MKFNPQKYLSQNKVNKPLINISDSDLSQIKKIKETVRKLILESQDGEKHIFLLKASHLLGGAVGANLIDKNEASSFILDIIQSKPNIESLASAKKTIESGISKGMNTPLELWANITKTRNSNDKISPKANENSLLLVKRANEWINQSKLKPIPKMLFGEFWFENELSILFADTNQGKSILAVQIADSISKGENIHGFKLETPKQPVLYCDFELSDKQFENRYSVEYDNHYKFDSNFFRIEINPNATIPESQSFDNFLNDCLEKALEETQAKILIIDNLTFLKNETEKAKDALPLMKHLKALKTKHNLSILALAHTPKRDLSKPITRNDLSGSKMLINFCDSVFSIGENHTDKNIKYLKQIKVRAMEFMYDSENIITCELDKPYNFLKFSFVGFSQERDHLKQHNDKDDEEMAEAVMALHKEGNSLRAIGAEMGISHTKAKRIIEKCNGV
jgi:RecA-family ATPase